MRVIDLLRFHYPGGEWEYSATHRTWYNAEQDAVAARRCTLDGAWSMVWVSWPLSGPVKPGSYLVGYCHEPLIGTTWMK